ncbi:hypothetical protein IWW37_006110 [Coemansia sp. RSA 2050]|nr:hypothetical protein IWW37_006110 [Coemansia sp. RSA 2050]KAJ2733689.1 hypothetical protein IW152_002872 [Coemansia sp. BCRC 34962]
MRFYIVLAILSYLVTLAFAAPLTDYVMLRNKAYKSMVKVYTMPKSKCVNVDKAFNKPDTMIYIVGRSVELYSGANCKNKFYTSKTSPGGVVPFYRSVMSFKVTKN